MKAGAPRPRASLLPRQHTTEFALLAAAATIVAVPIVVLYLFLQRRFIASMLQAPSKAEIEPRPGPMLVWMSRPG